MSDKDGQFVRLKCRKFYVDRERDDVNDNDKTARKLKFCLIGGFGEIRYKIRKRNIFTNDRDREMSRVRDNYDKRE